MDYSEKEVIGLVEKVLVYNLDGEIKEKALARIDTGAAKSSIDIELAAKLKLGPIINHSKVRNSHGTSIRAVVEAKIKIGEKLITEKFNIANRSKMKYRVLVGRNVLKHGFMINSSE
jgi:hypothetical protein